MKVRVLRRAVRDLIEIRSYLDVELPASSDALLDDLLEAVESLGRFPRKGPAPRDERLRALGYRYLSRGRYLIFYKVFAAEVRVYRVLHERRAYERLL